MNKKTLGLSGALMLVIMMLMLASLACYSGDLGLFELTPFYTPTPLPVDENAQFDVLETVLAPNEEGEAFFYMTLKPEPLLDNKTNTKALCEGNSAADILYAGRIYEEGGDLYLNEGEYEGRVMIPDIEADNGVIHVLNGVLLPEGVDQLPRGTPAADGAAVDAAAGAGDGQDMLSLLQQDDRFDFAILTAALEKAGLAATLQGDGPFTLFAPPDEAFENMLSLQGLTVDEFLASDPDALAEILLYHVAEGQLLQEDLAQMETVSTLHGTKVTIAVANIYYLADCVGSVGWVVEERLAGPLDFPRGQLALTLTQDDSDVVTLLDDQFEPQPAVAFGPQCAPGTIVPILRIHAFDKDGDGIREIYYRAECPLYDTMGNFAGYQKGWLTNNDLAGPAEIKVQQRALPILPPDAGPDFQLTTEPMPRTDPNVEFVDCPMDAVLRATDAQLIDDSEIYYKFTCMYEGDDGTPQEAEGWLDQRYFVGPLLYDPGIDVLLLASPVPFFADELPEEIAEQARTAAEQGTTEVEDDAGDAAADDVAADTGDDVAAAGGAEDAKRFVIDFAQPLYLTTDPALAIPAGDDANVLGQCTPDTVASIQEYEGVDTIYYYITCTGCQLDQAELTVEVAFEGLRGTTTVRSICLEEQVLEGWIMQDNLKGPLAFVPGDVTRYIEDSDAWIEDDDGDRRYVRIPKTEVGASGFGKRSEYAGRCLPMEPIVVEGVRLSQAETSTDYEIFYEVSCNGEPAYIEYYEDADGTREPQTFYREGELEKIEGLALPRDLEPVESDAPAGQ